MRFRGRNHTETPRTRMSQAAFLGPHAHPPRSSPPLRIPRRRVSSYQVSPHARVALSSPCCLLQQSLMFAPGQTRANLGFTLGSEGVHLDRGPAPRRAARNTMSGPGCDDLSGSLSNGSSSSSGSSVGSSGEGGEERRLRHQERREKVWPSLHSPFRREMRTKFLSGRKNAHRPCPV